MENAFLIDVIEQNVNYSLQSTKDFYYMPETKRKLVIYKDHRAI